ncbi:hypothetical protein IT575_13505 [bacterium]|nr:hypothetical protein [bacterium]
MLSFKFPKGLWIGLCAALLLLSLCACNSGGKARVDGDTVYLPTSSMIVRMGESMAGDPPGYKKFDGAYPSDWPRDFKLPENTHVQEGYKVELREPGMNELSSPGTKRCMLTAIAPGSPETLLAHFRSEIEKQGLKVEKDQASGEVESPPFGTSPGVHDLNSDFQYEKKLQTVNVKVMLDTDLDGWVLYTVNMTVKSS